jgi:hypothetical protein
MGLAFVVRARRAIPALFVLFAVAEAAADLPAIAGYPTITSVDVDGSDLYIYGANFGIASVPVVRLGATQLAVKSSPNAGLIVATLPNGTGPASYPLWVQSFTRTQGLWAYLGITIGAAGPAGAAGPKGDKGAQGDKGNPGAQGDKGVQGDKGDKGDTGWAGTSVTVTQLAAGDTYCPNGGVQLTAGLTAAYLCNAAPCSCGASCTSPAISCGGACTNLSADPQNCGGCGNACATAANATPVCVGGICGFPSCNPGFADCPGLPGSGCETNIATDPAHCGACNIACASGQVCIGGSCQGGCLVATDCPAPQACDTVSHTCTTACGNVQGLTGCNGGCCSLVVPGGPPKCVVGNFDDACGQSGGFCSNCLSTCAPGPACVSGACGCTASSQCQTNLHCGTHTTCDTTTNACQ